MRCPCQHSLGTIPPLQSSVMRRNVVYTICRMRRVKLRAFRAFSCSQRKRRKRRGLIGQSPDNKGSSLKSLILRPRASLTPSTELENLEHGFSSYGSMFCMFWIAEIPGWSSGWRFGDPSSQPSALNPALLQHNVPGAQAKGGALPCQTARARPFDS